MSKKLVSPSGDLTKDLVFFLQHHYGNYCFRGNAVCQKDLLHFSPMNRIKGLEKCTKSKAAYRFLTLPPSIIRRTVRICPIVDLFFMKSVLVSPEHLLYFGLYSVGGSELQIFGAIGVSVIPLQFFAKPKSPFFGNGSMQPSVHLSITSPLYRVLYRWSKMSLNFWVIAVI